MGELDKRALARLDELIALGEEAHSRPLALRRFLTSARNLLQNVLGKDSVHFEAFNELTEDVDYPGDLQERVDDFLGVIYAARDDIAGGFIFTRDLLVSAANFGDILGQAEHLLSAGYKDAAAVLTGAVLESSLRKLCDKRGLAYTPKETTEPLNVKLAKDGAYQPMTQKMITTWGDLRNNAAHGHFDRYTEADVRQMHQWVSGLVEQQLR
ncbi:MAG: DUF4145 domain-containing protein [Chloroflexota bacterium]|nr:DUF4145 domain-containing protein [Chloroflexota bacterium]